MVKLLCLVIETPLSYSVIREKHKIILMFMNINIKDWFRENKHNSCLVLFEIRGKSVPNNGFICAISGKNINLRLGVEIPFCTPDYQPG